jgi:hypothetical protein
LREERRLDAFAGLVSIPKPVAKRLDNVIGSNADVRGPLGHHLQHGVKDSGHGAEPRGFTGPDAAQTVKVPEQLVRSVD